MRRNALRTVVSIAIKTVFVLASYAWAARFNTFNPELAEDMPEETADIGNKPNVNPALPLKIVLTRIMTRKCIEDTLMRFEDTKAIFDKKKRKSKTKTNSSGSSGSKASVEKKKRNSRTSSSSAMQLDSYISSHSIGKYRGSQSGSHFKHQTKKLDTVLLVQDLWDAEDEIDNKIRRSRFSTFKRLFYDKKNSSSKNIRDLYTRIERRRAELESNFGLSYSSLEMTCSSGAGDATRKCIQDENPDALRDSVSRLLDLDDFGNIHHPPIGESRSLKKIFDRERAKVVKILGPSIKYDKIKVNCKERAQEDFVNRLAQHAKREFFDPVSQNDKGTCVEKRGSVCPEGTHISDNFRYFSRFFKNWFAQGAILVMVSFALAPLPDWLQAAYRDGQELVGSLSAEGAFAAGGFLGALTATVTTALQGRSSKCYCAIAPCTFDRSDGKCKIKQEDSTVNRNSYASLLPAPGLKCVKKENHNTCRYEGCTAKDYDGQAGKAREMLEDEGIFGKLGRNGSNIFNCLSRTGSPTSAFLLDSLHETGAGNNPVTRGRLFDKAGIA